MAMLRDPLLNVLRGLCMGTADVIPGVSGGTMALLLGIYTRLLRAVRAFDLGLLRMLAAGRLADAARHVDLALLVPLGAGILGALLFFTRVVPLPRLLVTHPEPIYALFFGLIAASVVSLVRESGRLGPGDAVALAAGAAIGFALVNLVPVATPDTAVFTFLAGALAICAMILPGISGSFVLLILHKYTYVFDAVGRFDFGVLLPFGLGAVTGLLAFSRFLDWLLRRFYRATLLTMAGLLVGSLWLIWPFQERVYAPVGNTWRLLHSAPVWPPADASAGIALGAALTGAALVLGLHAALAGRRSP